MASTTISLCMGPVSSISSISSLPTIATTTALLVSPWMGVVTTICATHRTGVRTNHTQAQPASSTSTSSAAAAAAVLSQTNPKPATPSTRMATPIPTPTSTPQPTHPNANAQTHSPIPVPEQPLTRPIPTPSEASNTTRSNVVMAPSAPTAGASMKSPLKKIAQNILDEYANKLPAPLPLKFFHEFGILQSQSRRLLASKWLKAELPVRLARRYRELELMPRKICNMPSILKVRDTYRQSFIDIVSFPDFDAVPSQSVEAGERINAFVNLLQTIYLNHRDVARNVATGLLEFKDYNPGVEFSSDSKLQTFLDNFFTSRISIRLMIGHYLAAFDKVPGKIGLVNLECNPAKLVQAASVVAQGIARNHYHMSQVPDICIRGDISTTFPYIDEHVTFCARETLKNALRSVIEKYADSALTLGYPPIEVIIAKGKEDISLRISDKGFGVKRRDIDKIFAFGYTTAASPPAFSQSKVTNIFDDDKHGRIAGLGYGVPLARLYGAYFGGNMKFYSMEGHGTDVVFHFPKLQV